jgi:hypothetical protein
MNTKKDNSKGAGTANDAEDAKTDRKTVFPTDYADIHR